MTYRFVPVAEDTRPLTIAIGIAGGSGTGKTYSALRLARGIAGGKPFGVIDTENRRAVHYRQDFPEMMHLDLPPMDEKGEVIGYAPERWIAVIDAAEAAGLPVVVIDSFSHAWEGIGGVLELHAEALERLTRGDQSKADRMSMLAWAEVKPRYRRLLERIIRAKCHIIICMRAKSVVQARDKQSGQMMNSRATKLRRADLPWDIAADKDLVFEMTASFLMTPERPGVPIPLKCADQFKPTFGNGVPIGEAAGEAMAKWSNGGDTLAAKALLDEARAEARKGKAAVQAHWQKLDRDQRRIVNSIMDELKDLAAEADEAPEDPFADDTAGEDPEEAERRRREAFADSDAAARGEAA